MSRSSVQPSMIHPIKQIKGIVFDLDDTLYPQVSYKRSGFKVVSAWIQKYHNIDQSVILLALETILNQYGAVYPYMFDRLVERLNLEQSLVPEMVRVFIDHEPQINCWTGVLPMLSRLRSRYHLGILTDGRLTVQQKKIRALGLEQSVDQILCSDALGLQKPAMELFRWFEKKFELYGKNLMYVGDNPRKDFIGVRALRWFTIRVRTGEYAATAVPDSFDADLFIDRVGQLESLIH